MSLYVKLCLRFCVAIFLLQSSVLAVVISNKVDTEVTACTNEIAIFVKWQRPVKQILKKVKLANGKQRWDITFARVKVVDIDPLIQALSPCIEFSYQLGKTDGVLSLTSNHNLAISLQHQLNDSVIRIRSPHLLKCLEQNNKLQQIKVAEENKPSPPEAAQKLPNEDKATEIQAGDSVKLVEVPAPAAIPAEILPPAPQPAPPPPPVVPIVSIKCKADYGELVDTLTCTSSQPFNITLYPRGDKLIAMTDQVMPIVLEEPENKLVKPLFLKKVIVYDRPKEVACLALESKAYAKIEANEQKNSWVVKLSYNYEAPEQNIAPLVSNVDRKLRAFLPISGGEILKTIDPITAEKIILIPTAQKIRVAKHFEYSDFELLRTIHGVVIVPHNPQLSIASSPMGIELSTPNGLWITQTPIIPKYTIRDSALQFKLDPEISWKTYYKDLQKKFATDGSSAQRFKALIELAQFYVATGFNTEACSILQENPFINSPLAQNYYFVALNGLASFFNHEYEKSLAYFQDPLVDKYPEMKALAFVAHLVAFGGEENLEEFNKMYHLLLQYPPSAIKQLSFLGLEAALRENRPELLRKFLGLLDSVSLKKEERDYYDYYLAHALNAEGKSAQALDIWRKLVDKGTTKTKALANLSMVQQQLRGKEFDSAEAITALERAEILIKGDTSLENTIMLALGELYKKNDDIIRAMPLWKELLKRKVRFQEVKNNIAEIFGKIFNTEEAFKQEWLKTIVYFEELLDVYKTEPKYFPTIDKAVERLEKMQLHNRANLVIEKILPYVDKPELKVKYLIQISKNAYKSEQYNKVIDSLSKIDLKVQPDAVTKEIAELYSHALLKEGKHQDAVNFIKARTDAWAYEILFDIYIDQGDWKNAYETFDRLIEKNPYVISPEVKLSDVQRANILAFALSAFMLGDIQRMDSVRQRFANLMKGSKDEKTFFILTHNTPLNFTDHLQLAEQIKSLKDFVYYPE